MGISRLRSWSWRSAAATATGLGLIAMSGAVFPGRLRPGRNAVIAIQSSLGVFLGALILAVGLVVLILRDKR